MKIFDGHCDALYKMFIDQSLNFENSKEMHVTYHNIKNAGIKVQSFAIYVPESVHPDLKFNAALYMVDLFYEKILKRFPEFRLVKTKQDLSSLEKDEIGAILTLEGCDCIGSDLVKLKTLLRLGVTAVGLTWNYANDVADGSLEERGAGLSKFGKSLVALLNQTETACDVSHLSDMGFWDVVEWADLLYASHSNCYSLCPHPRNLRDEQIEALIERDSVIGITFVPKLLTGKDSATITDILRHIEHICALGGENHVGFGSDFDGVEKTVLGLFNTGDYDYLANELQKYYSNIQVEKFMYQNMAKRILREK